MKTYIGNYQEMIDKAVEMILAAAEKIQVGDLTSRIYAAGRDVDMKIGKVMEKTREEERNATSRPDSR